MSDHNKCPSSEKEHEKCIFRLAYFQRIQPIYILYRYIIDSIIYVLKTLFTPNHITFVFKLQRIVYDGLYVEIQQTKFNSHFKLLKTLEYWK